MRLGLISDVHFGPPAYFDGKLRKLSHRATELVGAFVTEMNERERPDWVIQMGDAIEDQDRTLDLATYHECLSAFRGLDCEILHLAGNHDLIHLTEEDLKAAWRSSYGLFHSQDREGFHFVVLTARSLGKRGFEIPPEQLAWLEQDLRAATSPTVVFLHHPLGEMNLRQNRWFERDPHLCLVSGRERVREVLEASGRVVAVFCGHAHWNHLSVIRGIPYVTLQSLIENIDEDSPGRPARSAAVVDLSPEGMSVRVLGEQPARYELHFR